MENNKPNQELSPLSATKAKVMDNCSWLYWCTHHLKLPQGKNEGSMKGEVCHWIFEVLINPKHKHHVDSIIKYGSVTASKAVERLIKLYIKKAGLSTLSAVLEHIDSMVLVGLRTDFYGAGGVVVAPEYRFDIKTPQFRIKGLMDKPVIHGDVIIIEDYKSSKKKFEGEDEESNMQALFYCYASRRIWPKLKPKMRFIFLQYPENPLMDVEFSDETLNGFEQYLIYLQDRVNTFHEKMAWLSFAADREPHDGGFNGKLLCGFAKAPKELKKDGTPKWHCAYKFPFEYFILTNSKGDTLKTSMNLKDLNPKTGEKVIRAKYNGCPRFNSQALDHVVPSVIPKFKNVLDDF